VDARLSYDSDKTMEQAHEIIKMYEDAGISRKRILIKIASTWQGIKAAEKLETEGIHCNLTLLFGLHQAVACAEAKVTLVSPFVGRILDWYKKDTGKDYVGAEDPGVQSVTHIYNYYKKFGYKTQVMGASFRNTGEIKELAGCDLLTISPKYLHEMDAEEAELPRKLDPAKADHEKIEKIRMNEQVFEDMHKSDRMAHDKLKEGIEGFSEALENLEKMLAKRLTEISDEKTVALFLSCRSNRAAGCDARLSIAQISVVGAGVQDLGHAPILAHAPVSLGPCRQSLFKAVPVHHRRLVAPVKQMRHRRAVRTVSHVGAHALPAVPGGHGPESPAFVSQHGAALESICPPYLAYRALAVHREERQETDRTNAQTCDADEGHGLFIEHPLKCPASLHVAASICSVRQAEALSRYRPR
jgi:transaldolase